MWTHFNQLLNIKFYISLFWSSYTHTDRRTVGTN